MEAGCTREAVDMYNKAGQWEQAHKVKKQLQTNVLKLTGKLSKMHKENH